MNHDRITLISVSEVFKQAIKCHENNDSDGVTNLCDRVRSWKLAAKCALFSAFESEERYELFEDMAKRVLTSDDIYWMAFNDNMFSISETMLKMYIRLGHDINMVCDKTTLLHSMLYQGKTHAAKRLIDHGADLNIEIEGAQTPIQIIRERGSELNYSKEFIDYAESMSVPIPEVKMAE